MPALAPRAHRRGRRTINEINMVPFIDVMLVLLIIFMVTAPLISPSLIQLPSVGKADARPPEVIQIVIEKDESMELKSANRSMPVTVTSNTFNAEQMVIQFQDINVNNPAPSSTIGVNVDGTGAV